MGGTVQSYADFFGGAQPITGYGFFIDNHVVPATGAQTIRFDAIVFSGTVPEPSRALLLLAACCVMLLHRRRI